MSMNSIMKTALVTVAVMAIVSRVPQVRSIVNNTPA